MLRINVWLYVIIAVLVVPATLSRKLDLMESLNSSKRGLNPGQEAAIFFAGGLLPIFPDIYIGLGDEIVLQRLPMDPTNTIYYVSVFDTSRNIPHYSAYTVTREQAADIGKYTRISFNWRNPEINKKVIPLREAYDKAIGDDQDLQRGHMNPSGINSFSEQYMKATFTFSNVAPIFKATDTDVWNKYEDQIRKYAHNTCGNLHGGTLYLLTGTTNHGFKLNKGEVVTDTSKDATFNPKKISTTSGIVTLHTPRAIWTAGCCVWTEPGLLFRNLWPYRMAQSFAVMCNNRRNNIEPHLTEISVAKLEELLEDPKNPNKRVTLFTGKPGCGQPQDPNFKLRP